MKLTINEIVQALRCHADCQKTCDPCVFAELMETDENCTTVLCTAAADLIEAYVDRCARFSEEIMVLQEQRKKVEQPGGCAFAPWCDAVREQRRWIPVEERLPERDDCVLVCASGKPQENITLCDAVELATYSGNEGWILECWPEWETADVTYWMPLPPAPEDA